MDHPRLNNPALSNIMKDYQQKEKECRDARVRNQTGASLIDGEQYSEDQHLQVCEFGLRGDGISRASRSDEHEDAMMRTYHLCGDEFLQRSEGRAQTHLRDAHMHRADPSEGDQQMQLLVHHEDRSKTNQGGLLVRHGTARQRSDPVLDLSFQFGLFLFVRFVVKGHIPENWDNRQEVVDWLEENVFHAKTSRASEMTNKTANTLLNRACLKTSPVIKFYHVSHLGRKSKGKRADLAGIPDYQQRRQGVWNLEDAKNRSYTTNLPMEFTRWSGGHGFVRGDYHVPRDNVQPSADLVDRVFPFLPTLREANRRDYSVWIQETIELLEYLGKMLLQDIAVIKDDIQHSTLSHDPFSHGDFDEFQASLLEAIAADTSHDPSTFRSPAAEIRLAEERINKNVERLISKAVVDIVAKVGGNLRAAAAPAAGAALVNAPAVPAPAPPPPQEPRHQPPPQMPHDVTTWRPRRLILPTFASQYVPDDLTTVEKFVKECLHGTRGRPPLYYGPGKKRGNLPTWRSQSTRGAGIRKYDQLMCRRKKLYDQIDAGVTADGFYDVVRRENNELFSDPKYQRDGTILRWLIQYYTRKGSR